MSLFYKVFGNNRTVGLFWRCYHSAQSLSKLYPESSLKLTTPDKFASFTNEGFSGFVPINELDISYSRSSGPGGQNVNKVNTKVEIRFHVDSAKWLTEEIKTKLNEKYKNKITREGFIIFVSDVTRSQHLNVADCLEKIRTVIRRCALKTPEVAPETAEVIRRRLERATRERLAVKRERSFTKSNRQAPCIDL